MKRSMTLAALIGCAVLTACGDNARDEAMNVDNGMMADNFGTTDMNTGADMNMGADINAGTDINTDMNATANTTGADGNTTGNSY